MAEITKDDVLGFIENMTVLELSGLVKELEEKFGAHPGKIRKGTINHANILAEIKEHLGLGLRRFTAHVFTNMLHFFHRKRRRILHTTQKAGHLWRLVDHVPNLIPHLHLNQEIAWEKLP